MIAALAAILLGLPGFVGRGAAQSVPPHSAGIDGILLLRNGQTLSGRIAWAGDRYFVGINGGEISVRASEVDMVCRSLDEAYQQRRAKVQPENINDRLELAQWCQRQGLFGAAAQELAEAMAVDPNHPMIPVVERRLRLAMDQRPAPDQPANTERVPTPDELDRMVRGMPPGTVETFTQTIQPMLMNNCTTSGCHGPGAGQGLSLLRAPTGRPPSRRLTQRNLVAVLQWINRSEPAGSPLLAAPTRAHGTARAPIFTDRQVAQYQDLVDWVYNVCQVPSPVSANRHREQRRPSHVMPAGHEAPITPEGRPARPQPFGLRQQAAGALNGQAAGGLGSLPAGNRDTNLPPSKPSYHRAQPIPSSAPVDSFDPEVFNRQFAPPPRPARSPQPPPAWSQAVGDEGAPPQR